MKVRVSDLTGKYAITLDDGQAVYDSIYPTLSGSQNVELDFDGVEIFASPFFNAAIGQLLREFTPESLKESLSVVNLDSEGRDVLKQVIANSRRYYSDLEYRENLERILIEEVGSA